MRDPVARPSRPRDHRSRLAQRCRTTFGLPGNDPPIDLLRVEGPQDADPQSIPDPRSTTGARPGRCIMRAGRRSHMARLWRRSEAQRARNQTVGHSARLGWPADLERGVVPVVERPNGVTGCSGLMWLWQSHGLRRPHGLRWPQGPHALRGVAGGVGARGRLGQQRWANSDRASETRRVAPRPHTDMRRAQGCPGRVGGRRCSHIARLRIDACLPLPAVG